MKRYGPAVRSLSQANSTPIASSASFSQSRRHSRRVLEQVTVYAEARIVTEDVIVEAKVQTRIRKKVDSISVIFDRARGELDVVSIGGRKFIEGVANAFFQAFATETPLLEPLIRRPVNFEPLSRVFRPTMADQSRFTFAKIDEIRVQSPSGALYTSMRKAIGTASAMSTMLPYKISVIGIRSRGQAGMSLARASSSRTAILTVVIG